MLDKLGLIMGAGGLIAALYVFAVNTEPGKGLMNVIERVCAGAMLCWLCHVLMKPLGISIAQSPLAALSAGYLGLPGVALISVLAGWP